MSESKQEARLPERMEREIDKGISLIAELTVWAHERGWRGDDEDPRLGWLDRLRSAIHAALDEARDEALGEAAKIADDIRITAPTAASRIRALKSKPGA